MTLSIKSQFIASAAGVGLLVIGTIYAMVGYWGPRLENNHHEVAKNQAAITAIQRQQQNLAGVTQQLSERQDDQVKLNEELWAFSKEGTFYDLWDPLATSTQTDISLDTISEATPGELPVRRDATITIIGSLTNVWQVIARVTALKPSTVIQDFEFTPDDKGATVVARLTVATLWYDDTLH